MIPRAGASARTTGRLEEGVVLAAVVVVAAALRWRWLGQPIRYDEAVTWLEYASWPLPEALSRYDLPNNHLLHTLLAHLSTDVLGPGVRPLRLPAYLAGVLTVPATWALGRRLHGARAGLLAAALVAVSPVLVLFSTNARGYAIVVLAFLGLALLAAELRRRSSSLLWAAFAVTAALAGWTMPAALYPAVAAGVWIVWPARRGEAVRPLTGRLAGLAAAGVGATGLTALLYAPVLRRSGWRSVAANRFVAPDPFDEFIGEVPAFLTSVLREWAHGLPAWLVGLFGLGAAVAAAGRVAGRSSRPGRGGAAGDREEAGGGEEPPRGAGASGRPPPLLPATLLGSVLVLLATRRTPFARVWLHLLPAVAVFAAAGLGQLVGILSEAVDRGHGGATGGRRGPTDRLAARGSAGLALAVLVAGGVHLLRADPVTTWGLTGSLPAGDRVAGLLAGRMGPGDAVRAPIPSDAPLEYYFSRMGIDRERVNDIPGPAACLWIVVNRRHGTEGPGEVVGGRAEEAPRLVRDFGGSAVYVRPSTSGGIDADRADDTAGGTRAGAPRCGPDGGDAAGPGTDSPGTPPAHGGDEPAER